jgi:hypothetical protein
MPSLTHSLPVCQALISGSSDLDVKDWRTHTELENYTVHDPQIRWFWTVVEAMDASMKVRQIYLQDLCQQTQC